MLFLPFSVGRSDHPKGLTIYVITGGRREASPQHRDHPKGADDLAACPLALTYAPTGDRTRFALRASRFALRASRFALCALRFALRASRFVPRASRFALPRPPGLGCSGARRTARAIAARQDSPKNEPAIHQQKGQKIRL